MKTPTSEQVIFALIITAGLCLCPYFPISLLQEGSLYLLLCLPLIILGFYYLTDIWQTDSNSKTLSNKVLWLIAMLLLLILSGVNYIFEWQQIHYFWQALAVLIATALGSLHLLGNLQKRSSIQESRLKNLCSQLGIERKREKVLGTIEKEVDENVLLNIAARTKDEVAIESKEIDVPLSLTTKIKDEEEAIEVSEKIPEPITLKINEEAEIKRSEEKPMTVAAKIIEEAKLEASRNESFTIAAKEKEAIDSEFLKEVAKTSWTIYGGDLIPIDGVVVSGKGLVDESALTGNKMLQDKEKGLKVWAGTRLELGQLNVEANVENGSASTFLEQSLTELEGLKQKLPIEDSVMHYFNNAFVITVLFWAGLMGYWRYQALIAVKPALEMLSIWTEALTLSVVILLVVCPIAIASTVPLAYGRLMDYLFGKGVRLQNSLLVKTISKLKHLVFNKTGVLTTGVFHIQNFHTSIPSDDFKAILLALEQHSQHPYARAIMKHFGGDVTPLDLEDIRQVNGLGIMGKDASGNTYMAGAYNIAAEFTKEDEHSIYVLKNNQLVAWLDLEDRLREEAEPCITALEEEGIKAVLLSGDRAIPTQYTARKTGIKNFHFQQLPEQKKGIIEQLQVEGLTGIVAEENGTDVFLDSASLGIELEVGPNADKNRQNKARVIISHHRLLLVNELVSMCSTLVHRVRWISIFVVVYNVFVLILASLGYFSLILAVLSSFIVWAIISLLLKL